MLSEFKLAGLRQLRVRETDGTSTDAAMAGIVFIWYWRCSFNRRILPIPQCISKISQNAPFCNRNVHTCAHFCCKMLHSGIRDYCIVGFMKYVNNWRLLPRPIPRPSYQPPTIFCCFHIDRGTNRQQLIVFTYRPWCQPPTIDCFPIKTVVPTASNWLFSHIDRGTNRQQLIVFPYRPWYQTPEIDCFLI